MTHLETAVIVGGGIGGLSAALALARSGTADHVEVLERSPTFEELGAGLQVAPNAMRALGELGVADAIDAHAFHPGRLVLLDALTGERITTVDLGAPFRARYGEPYLVMHRGDLLQALLDAVEQYDSVELCSDEPAVAVRPDAAGATVRTARGRQVGGDVVVGADGLRSVVRAGTVGDAPPTGSRYVSYRGTVPFADVAEIAGGRDVLVWVGPRMHLVQYPIRGGLLYNQVACFESDRYSPEHDEWGTPDELDARFAGACDEVRAGVALMARGRRWQMLDRDPVGQWVFGRIALLGDAAHPMLQYLAQGAGQALEDAVALGAALRREPDPATALAAYQAARVPRTAQVQRTAREFGELLHVGGIAAGIRREFLHGRRSDDYTHLDWLYAA